jgi:hypothetical protein
MLPLESTCTWTRLGGHFVYYTEFLGTCVGYGTEGRRGWESGNVTK